MGNTDLIAYQIDLSSPLPRYHQIKNHIRELIDNDVLVPGHALPSEKDLATSYGVNRLTLRHAVTELVTEGLLVRRHGVGTFVAEPKLTQSHARLLSFTQRMAQMGRAAHSRLLEAVRLVAPVGVARQLQVPPHGQIFRIMRLRLADNRPVMIETAYIPEAICPGLLEADLTASLYHILTERFSISPNKADQFLEPVRLTEWEADLLEVDAGVPALLVETTVRDGDDRVVEFSKGILRGDISRLYFHSTNVEPSAPFG